MYVDEDNSACTDRHIIFVRWRVLERYNLCLDENVCCVVMGEV